METKNPKQLTPSEAAAPARCLPSGLAEISIFHGPLPSWYRYDVRTANVELTRRRAYEILVSATCYLAVHHGSVTQHDREACTLLKDCALQLRDTVEEMRSAPEEMEALMWQEKQIRWKRYSRMFPKQEAKLAQLQPGPVKSWLSRWRTVPKVVAL